MVGSAFQTVSPNGHGVDLQSAAAVRLKDGNVVLLTTAHGLNNNTSLQGGNEGDTFVKQVNENTGKEIGRKISSAFAILKNIDLAVVDIPDDAVAESDIVSLAPESSLKAGDKVSGSELLTGDNSQPETKSAEVESRDDKEGTFAVNETNKKFEQGNSGGQILNSSGQLVGLVQGEETQTVTDSSGTTSDRDGKAIDITNPMVRQEIKSLVSQIATA